MKRDMSKKRICFIAQFPPPMHGLSKAVDTLYRSELNKEYDFEKVNITDNKNFIKNMIQVARSHADLFYFTISQTRGGNFRDLLLLKFIHLKKRRCLVHLHGGYYRTLIDGLGNWQKKANYKAIARLNGAIVLGPSLKWIFAEMLPEDKIFTVPNCVDDEYLMSDEEFEEKLSTIEERKIKHVLYLSNLIGSKGYPEVLKMAKFEKERCLLEGYRKYHFDFAGNFFEKEEETFFFSYVREHRLEEYVTYHGMVDKDKKRALIKKSDIFVLLTRYPKEGQPISILEAMGNGMLIVTTDHAGIPDIIGNDNYIVRKNTKVEYKVMEQYFDNNTIIQLYRTNRNTVLEKYTEQKYVAHMRKVYQCVLAEKKCYF